MGPSTAKIIASRSRPAFTDSVLEKASLLSLRSATDNIHSLIWESWGGYNQSRVRAGLLEVDIEYQVSGNTRILSQLAC